MNSSATFGFNSDITDKDADDLRRKYQVERDKRLRKDGLNQYIRPDASTHFFESYIGDPYATGAPKRAAVHKYCDVLLIGGGFGGLLAAAHLRDFDVNDFLIIEDASDFGGTWYWNRYPGVACDVESYVYMPMLERLGKVPTEKYASGPEIRQHCVDIANYFNLYPQALFSTQVTEMVWQEEQSRWIVSTNMGDRIEARFVSMSTGPLNRPKLPGVAGLDKFRGRSFHSCRWDYQYTGGDEYGNLHRLSDKRVGVVGTGSTGIQIIPHLGNAAKHLFVFQRTPSSIQPRGNHATDPKWKNSLKPGWQAERMINFTSIICGLPVEDMVSDGWTKTFRLLFDNRGVPVEQIAEQMERRDLSGMHAIHQHIQNTVDDPDTAEKLKPYYNLLCKRLGFSDTYLQTFNKPNVSLVDTSGKGIECIDETGVVVGGKHYELDCLVFATGFEWLTEHKQGSGFDIIGRDATPQSKAWENGVHSLYGIHSRNFPNRFILSNSQQAHTANFAHMLEVSCHHVAGLIKYCLERGVRTVEPSDAAESEWVAKVVEMYQSRQSFYESCTPGYYNNEGEFSLKNARNAGYSGSFLEFAKMLEDQRNTGNYSGLEMT